jgi:hypothetical protein
LKQAQNYLLAATYYEKAIFELNSPTDDSLSATYRLISNDLLSQKIQCQKIQRAFEEAWQSAQRFDLNEPNDSLQFRLRYESVLCAYLSQHYSEAYNQIQQTRFYVQDSSLIQSLEVLEILTLNELERWTESKEVFRKYATRNQLSINVDELYSFLKKKPRNPDKAQLMSFLLPGLGQAYAGYWKQGLTSAGLQVLALGFGVYHAINRYYLIGFFTGAGMFQAFYFGGAKRATMMAEETNKKRKVANNQKLRAELIKAEQQKKE